MDIGIPLLDDIVGAPPAPAAGGLGAVLINFGNTTGTYIGSGNWNHAFQNFTAGVIAITGDNSGQSLASLRTVDGVLTGWGISNPSLFGGDVVGQNSAGLYPQSANKDCWSNASGTRSTTITGLNPAKTYRFKLLPSVDTATEATSLGDFVISGASGGVTSNSFDERGNVNNLVGGASGTTVVPTAGGVVTIATTVNTGHCAISVLEIQEL